MTHRRTNIWTSRAAVAAKNDKVCAKNVVYFRYFQANILEKRQNITIVLLLMPTWRGIYHWEVVKETLLSNEKKNKGRGHLLS